ncbi:hypothetical protein ACEQPO_18565 [Bacillus sp. SL00103]
MALNRSGKIPFVISCQGQEAQQVGVAFALNRKRITSYLTTVIWGLSLHLE